GNVGIGTTTPAVGLHVYNKNAFFDLPGGGAAERNFTIKHAGTAQIGFGTYPGAWTPALQIQNNNNSRYVWISPLDSASGGNARLVTGGSDFDIMPGNVQAATFTTGGNVGIGKTGPGYKLDVNGTVATYAEYPTITIDHPTSGGTAGIRLRSRSNFGSDIGYLLLQDDSANTLGSSAEDVRLTLGVYNDFYGGGGSHSDELWLQGGGRLVQNVGNWDAEMNSLIGGVGQVKTVGQAYEWRINNAAKMLMDISGKVGIGTTGPGYILDVNGTSGFRSIDKIGPGSNNPERGPWNVLWTAIGAGRAVYMDEEFASGSNSIGVYNNSGGNGVQHYWENGNGSQPNRSGKWLRIYNNGNATSPGYGGFVQTISSRRNATFVQRFRARLPSGYNLNIAENSQGTNNTSYWLTSTAGTGMWEEYIRVSHCGSGGTFSSGGHVYVTGPSSVFTWYLASCNVYEVDSPPGVFAGDVTVGGNLSVNGNLYAPIFYDSNDNGYYVDPNSTSNSALRMRGGALFGPNPSWGAYLYVGSNGNVSGTATVAVTSGNLHIDSASSGYGTYLNWYSRGPIYYGSGTRIAINGSSITSGSAYGFGNGAAYNNMNSLAVDTLETDGGTGGGGTLELNYYGGNEVHIGPSGTKPLRAAIMYDGNNGSYYVNPNDTSVLNVVQVNGYMLRGGHSTGYLAGSYNNIGANSSRSNPIYTIGTNYAPTDNSLNNMYGIGYTHRNFWGSDSNKPSGWGQYVAADGDIRVILSGSNGQIWSSGDIRSPIFYDSNNTGYYVDPNGTSNLYAVTDYTRAAFNLPRTYVNRRDITSDQNYWTGTNGWGTGYGTWDDAWKWGFSGVDIWGTSTGHPQGSGYIHAQGIISGEHYATSNGNRGYGWMMVGAANATENRYWLRGKWSTSTSGWVEMITTGNVSSYTIPWNTWIYNHYFGTDGAEYATIYYDTNDSGYYANPNGTSRLRQLNLTELYMVGGGWLRNYNRTGMYSQSYGGHFYWDSAAYIDLSNNNGMRFRTNTSYDSGLAGYVYHDGNGFGLLSADGNWRIRTQPGYQELYGTTYENSTQSYIYYDRNDTGYYIDPNSTSNTALRMRGGALFGPNSTWGAYLYIGTNGNVGGTATVAATNGNLHIDSASSGYGLYLNYYQSGPIWACNNNYIYDINDSAYYMDLNGTSRFNYMGRNYGYNWREYDWNNSGYWVDPNSCSRFYRLIRQQAYGWVEYDCNDNAYYVDPSGTSAFNDLRANIFYDRQNTGYYLDPNGSSRLNQIYYVDNLYSVYDRPQVIYDWNDSYYYIDLNSNGDAARFAGNIYVVTPESSSAWVRLGAAWNKPGVYSNQSLYLGSESMVVINDNNQENWYFDGDNFYSNGWGHIYSSSSNLHIDAYSGSIYLAYYYNTWVYVGNGNVGYLTIGSVRIQDNNDWFYICCLPNSRMWINGSLRVQGTLTVSGYIYKNGGGFQIDHPLDPANKVLVHSFVESPDMKNLYDGVVIIGENGESIIELPDWFEALNKDFRYQLTTIGKPGMSYVKEEIKDNKFTIAGDPGAKISWQVTGIRKDAYAEKHRIKVEEEKGSRDDLPKKGEYLTPEFYGEKE
nr:hypothetical protein [Candidatus Omnitrophota bacterium]